MPLPVINPTYDVPVILVNTPGVTGTFDFDFAAGSPSEITNPFVWSSQVPATAPPAGPGPFTPSSPDVVVTGVAPFNPAAPVVVAPGVPPYSTGLPGLADPGVPPFDTTAPGKLPMGGETPGRGDRILITKTAQPIAVR